MEKSLNVLRLFAKENGRADNYRIPAIVTTSEGVTIAAADERFFTGGDNPNRIAKVVRRSIDNGKTWQPQIVAVDEVGLSKEKSSASIDPCLVYSERGKKLFMLYSHTPAGIGILNNEKGTGYDSRGRKIILKDKKKLFVKDGRLVDAFGRDEGVSVDLLNGEIKDADGNYVCNFKVFDGAYGEVKTSYLYIVESLDNGVSWGEPRCLDIEIKDEAMCFIGAGPGVGLEIKNGPHAGRIVLPIYFSFAKHAMAMSNALIFSDDCGVTWHRGHSPNEFRPRVASWFSKKLKYVLPTECITESQLIELPDGTLKIFMRNHDSRREVATALSDDGGVTWHDFKFHPDLPQPICQVSVLNVDDNGRAATLFLNSATRKTRENGTIRLSYDYGETFVASRKIKDGFFVYSCMTQFKDGGIGVLYEGDICHETVDFIKITIDWIKNKE